MQKRQIHIHDNIFVEFEITDFHILIQKKKKVLRIYDTFLFWQHEYKQLTLHQHFVYQSNYFNLL